MPPLCCSHLSFAHRSFVRFLRSGPSQRSCILWAAPLRSSQVLFNSTPCSGPVSSAPIAGLVGCTYLRFSSVGLRRSPWLHSFGGPIAHVGFGLLAVCWMGSTLNAYRHIRQGNLSTHRNWMIRRYALTLAAVTLRLYLPSSQLAGYPMAAAYPAISWLCWVPNLLIAEWFVRSRHAYAMLPNNSFQSKLLHASA